MFAGYVSRRITDVGTFDLPDIYQEATPNVDFVYQYTRGERGQWQYRFEAENLTNTDFRWTQGPFTQRQYVLGRTFQIGLYLLIFLDRTFRRENANPYNTNARSVSGDSRHGTR